MGQDQLRAENRSMTSCTRAASQTIRSQVGLPCVKRQSDDVRPDLDMMLLAVQFIRV